jgi:hypothetical protein
VKCRHVRSLWFIKNLVILTQIVGIFICACECDTSLCSSETSYGVVYYGIRQWYSKGVPWNSGFSGRLSDDTQTPLICNETVTSYNVATFTAFFIFLPIFLSNRFRCHFQCKLTIIKFYFFIKICKYFI